MPAANETRGFALLVTVTLLAFLVLLLVSLASLTRVETQVAANTRELAQARQNALLALNIALGQLQKYAGPDQRTTARADIDASLADDSGKNGRWTGVYGSRVSADYADTPDRIADKIAAAYAAAGGTDAITQTGSLARKGSQAILLNWLVSGNESTAFNPSSDVAADGRITLSVSPSPSRAPGDTANLAGATAVPSSADSSTLLVGDGSVNTPSDRVTAPLVTISVPEGALPGFSSSATTPRTVGRYAWWVGDENTKARINLNVGASTAVADAFVAAQRAGVELLDAVHPAGSVPAASNLVAADLFGAKGYAPASLATPGLLTPRQLPLLSSGSAPALDLARKYRFHDITSSSLSLLTDTYAGGLKKDLSALLATGAAAPADTDTLYVPVDSTARNLYGVPTWGKLRAFVRPQTGVVAAGDPLDPAVPSATQPGIFPVLTFSQMAVEYFRPAPDTVRLAVFPYVVLWNPYTRPIKAHRYEFGMTTNNGKYQLQGRVPPSTVWTVRDEHAFVDALGTKDPAIATAYLRFVVDAEAIPPGESHIYTLPSPAVYQSAYHSAPAAVLRKGLAHSYAVLPNITITADPAEIFRVAGNSQNHIPVPPTASTSAIAWRSNISTYLGEVSSRGPDNPLWSAEIPDPDKPWFTSRAYVAMAGTVGDFNWFQGSSAGGPLLSAPGTATWGIQLRSAFGVRQRWIANHNPRAAIHLAVPFQGGRSSTAYLGTEIHTNDFDPSSDARASSATGLDVPATNIPAGNILFEFRSPDQPLLSLGQLQHANLSVTVNDPAYPVGNAQAPFLHLNAAKTVRDRLYRSGTGLTPEQNMVGGLYDSSYLLNRALWDRYFVSTVPHPGTNAAGVTALPDVLPNARHVRPEFGLAGEAADLADADKAAARLRIAGGFNVNSTSEQAWRAVLGGVNQLAYEPAGTPDSNPQGAALPRFSRPPAAITGTSTVNWGFTGYRRLDEFQIAALAANLVAEIRRRGPFVSLADFVNRRLRDNPDTATVTAGTVLLNADESLKGTLQNAIDGAPVSGAGSVNNRRDVAPFKSGTSIDAAGEYDGDAWRGGPGNGNLSQNAAFGSPSAFAAQFLTQADVLSAIGAGLSARSDTFSVRTYGETQNPVTGEITGRAWCEAVVQRAVEPVNRRGSDPSLADYNEPAAATATVPDFGRRFKIVSFRWLSSSDL